MFYLEHIFIHTLIKLPLRIETGDKKKKKEGKTHQKQKKKGTSESTSALLTPKSGWKEKEWIQNTAGRLQLALTSGTLYMTRTETIYIKKNTIKQSENSDQL